MIPEIKTAQDQLPYHLLSVLTSIAIAAARFPAGERFLRAIVSHVDRSLPGSSMSIHLEGALISWLSATLTIEGDPADSAETSRAEFRIPLHIQNNAVGWISFSTADARLHTEVVDFIKGLAGVIESNLERTDQEATGEPSSQTSDALIALVEDANQVRSQGDLADVVTQLAGFFAFDALHVAVMDSTDVIVSSVPGDELTGVAAETFESTRSARRAVEDHDVQIIVDSHRDDSAYLPLWRNAESAVIVPIVAAESVVGLIVLELAVGRTITNDDIRNLNFITTVLAVPITRLKAGRADAWRAFTAALTREITMLVDGTDSEEAFLNHVVETICNTMGWSCAIGILEGDRLRFPAVKCAAGLEPASWLDEDVPVQVGVVGRVARTGEPAYLPTIANDPDFLESSPDTTSEICLPLVLESTIVGVLNIEAMAPDRLDDVDFDQAVSLARLTELGLRVRRLRADLAGTVSTSEVLGGLVDATITSDEPAERATELLSRLQSRGLLANAAVWVLNNGTLELFVATIGSGSDELPRDELASELHPTLESAEPYVDLHRTAQIELLPDLIDLQGTAVLPIRRQGAVQGLLVVAGDAETPIESGQLEVIKLAADLIGLAIADVFSERELSIAAGLDPITGVPNIEFARQQLERLLSSADENGMRLSMLLIDVDEFREINQQFGRATGDELLRRIADELVEQLRGDDLIARFGSDEFLVCVPTIEDRDVVNIAARLSSAVGEIGPTTVRISSSATIGIASFPEDGESVDSLLRAAEAALNAAKRAGQGQITRYRDLSNLQRGDLVQRWYASGG